MKVFLMRLDDSDYKKLLAAAYKKIRLNGTRTRLTNPTRSDLRKECIAEYMARFNEKDQYILTDFFGIPGKNESFLDLMERFETENFRTLSNYMRGTTASTDNINTELLAWLIDFKHRPNRLDNHVILSDEEKEILGLKEPSDPATTSGSLDSPISMDPEQIAEGSKGIEGEKGSRQSIKDQVGNNGGSDRDNKHTKPLSQPWQKIVKRGAVILGIGAVVSGGMYAISSGNAKDCMYWTGDHYEKIDCGKKLKGERIIQLDQESIDLQKITREDTITEQSIGKIYYIQDKMDVQYFTQHGDYPGDRNRSLRKLTRRIFDKDSANRRSAKMPLP